jgi:phage recombination protein Bet
MSNDLIQTKSIIADLADRYGMEKEHFQKIMMATVMPSKTDVSMEQFVAFLSVAKEYDLNPLTKEIYAFPAKTGGIQPIVSIDGWMRIINGHKQFDGMVFKDIFDEKGKVIAIECSIYRKDRSHPICVTEYMSECKRNTEPWNKWEIRMLRHKAAIQCARYAFGFSGIYDQDEVERMVDVSPVGRQNQGFTKTIETMPADFRQSSNLNALLEQAKRNAPAVKQSLTPQDIVQPEKLEPEIAAAPLDPSSVPISPIPQDEPPLPPNDIFPGDIDVNGRG